MALVIDAGGGVGDGWTIAGALQAWMAQGQGPIQAAVLSVQQLSQRVAESQPTGEFSN